jgi:protein-disulfide isomerase
MEQAAGKDIAKLIDDGTVKVNYHMLGFLDDSSSGNRYSSRAANAAICASDVNPEAFHAFHTVLFGKDAKGNNIQPAEGGNGRTDADLEAYFKKAVPKATADQISAFQGCVSTEEHAALVSAITDRASKNGVSGTPTVYVNGKKWTMPGNNADIASSLVSAVNAAQKGTQQK